jgi:hypothetical protein
MMIGIFKTGYSYANWFFACVLETKYDLIRLWIKELNKNG